MKTLKFIILVIISVAVAACNSGDSTVRQENASGSNDSCLTLSLAQLKNIQLKTEELELRSISVELILSGVIEAPPQNIVSVSIPLGGYIQSSNLLPGMKIKKGQVLATVQDQTYIDLQKEYLESVIRLATAETEFNRQKELKENNATSDKIFQQTRTEYELLKTSVKALYEKLKLAGISPESLKGENISRLVNILSPIDGFVSKVNVNTGKYASPADVLFELVNPEDIHLKLRVYEKDLPSLSVGQKVLASATDSDKHFECEIILIGGVVAEDRSAEVHCHFKQYDNSLLPGMYMKAKVISATEAGLCVKNNALVNHAGIDYVFLDNNGNFCMKKVFINKSNVNYSLIRNEQLKVGDKIVVEGAHSLLSELKNREDE